ncbi:MAG: bacillithiol biosynthesis cysteine-adding enzyme BshC [Waddliaceae bacterium]
MKIVIQDRPKLFQETPFTSFLNISPRDPSGGERAREALAGRDYWRQDLSDLLLGYNRSIGNDAAALQMCKGLREKQAVCVITGQQLGFMGGPAYTILKGVTCLLLARELDAIPIFWLATEDHDVSEIDHTYLLDGSGNMKKYTLSLPKDGRFAEELQLDSHHLDLIKTFCQEVNLINVFDELRGETAYTRFMIRFLALLFKGTGLVFIEPFLLRRLAQSFFQREIVDCDAFAEVLQMTTRRLQQLGGSPQLNVENGTNLFIKMQGKYRYKLQREGKSFIVGREKLSTKTLLELVEREPERLSTNAAARAVLQSHLFPTVAYVAGPGEIAYYHQLKDYHEAHEVPMPWIVPRISATFLTPVAQGMLETCRLTPWEEIPSHWSQIIPGLDSGIEEVAAEWTQQAMHHFREDLSTEALSRFVRHYVGKLQQKIHASRLRRQGILPHSLHYLRNFLHPHGKLQERVLNWWQFQSNTQDGIIAELLKQADWKTEGHLYCFLK